MVSGVSQGMGVLDRGDDHRRGKGSFRVNLGHPIVNSFMTRSDGSVQLDLSKIFEEVAI